MQINYQKQIYSIASHHNLNKSIITTCISKYENAYMLYHDFNIYFKFKTITFHWESVATPLWAQMWEWDSHSQKVGIGSPLGLLQLQSSTVEGKTPRLEVFFILLKRSWSVNVQNGLTWAIWTSAAQVMGKRRARSQTGNLTPDH